MVKTNRILLMSCRFHSNGFPKVSVTYTYDLESKKANLKFKQTQEDKTKSIPLFDMKIPVRITDKNGNIHNEVVSFQVSPDRIVSKH